MALVVALAAVGRSVVTPAPPQPVMGRRCALAVAAAAAAWAPGRVVVAASALDGGTALPLRSVEEAALGESLGPMALYPDPVLRRTAASVVSFGSEVERVASMLVAAMKSNAITALQYGVDARIIALKGEAAPRGVPLVLVNPRITARSGEERMVSWREICLVFEVAAPDLEVELLRDETVTVAAQDTRGAAFTVTLKGEPARALQQLPQV